MPEDVQFQRGAASTMPEQIVPGTFSIQEDTGNMYLDITNSESVNERIQIKDSTKLPLDGSAVMTGNLDMGNFVIKNLGNAIDPGDAISKQVLEQVLQENQTFIVCPSELDNITQNGIYYRSFNTMTYSPLPNGTSDLRYLIHTTIPVEESGSTERKIQLGYFITEGTQGKWCYREFDTTWSTWADSSGSSETQFLECPQDIVTISENGIYYPFLTQTFSNGPENMLRPLVIIATKNPNDNSTMNLIGSFIMQNTTYRWFTTEYVLNVTSTYTWHEFVGTGGGGTTGNLPPGGSPDTILIGTEVSGQGAWTTTLPPAVIIDDGTID